jgi:radical SAM superfamily enzyme YgiQ (UPF0313 family)
MPSRVLLISINRCEQPVAVFPLGLAQIDATLRQAGHQSLLLDLNSSPTTPAQAITSFHPDIVGISLRNIDDVMIDKQEIFFSPLASLCREIRETCDAAIVLGGSGFSIFPERLLELSGADFGIQGEGEASFLRLLASLENHADPSDIPGLLFRRHRKIISNPQICWPVGDNPPASRPPDLARYYLDRSTMLNVQTQRGCSFTCCYCTYPVIEGTRFRRRHPDDIADEFAAIERSGCQYIFIVDSVFNSSPKHVRAICETLVKRGSKVAWGCFLRPAGLTAELLDLMARAGLAHIEFGSDSFSDSVLREYGKRFRFEDIQQSSDHARQAGVDFCHFLICGGPGETPGTLQESFDNSQRIEGNLVFPSVGMRIYPDTPLRKRAECEGSLAPDADLLPPRYYLSPRLTEEELTATLSGFARQSPRWIFGELSEDYLRRTARLRRQGAVGPLWGTTQWRKRLRDKVFPQDQGSDPPGPP